MDFSIREPYPGFDHNWGMALTCTQINLNIYIPVYTMSIMLSFICTGTEEVCFFTTQTAAIAAYYRLSTVKWQHHPADMAAGIP